MRGQAADIANIARKKQQLLETGFCLFSEKGIDAVIFPEIAEKSGVSRTSLYRYYPLKIDLVIAIGTWKWAEFMSEYRSSLTREQITRMTAAEHLHWYMDAFIDLYRNHRDILRFNYYFNSFVHSEKPAQEKMQPYMNVIEGLRSSFHEMYAKGMQDKTLNPEISEEEMLSCSFHIMLAAGTRYAVGLVYDMPERGGNSERELLLLEEALLQKFTCKNVLGTDEPRR